MQSKNITLSTLESYFEPIAAKMQEYKQVTECMINADGVVRFEADGKLIKTELTLSADTRLSIIRLLAGFHNLQVNYDKPDLACKLPLFGGARFQGIIPPVVTEPALSIRFPARQVFTLQHLVKSGTITDAQKETLKMMVKTRKNILFCGGTGSGKTTVANTLLNLILNQRVLVIEDTPEINIKNNEDTLYMQTYENFSFLRGVQTAMRMRPDRIIIGEIRDGYAATEFLKASSTGHPGSAATLHTNSATEAKTRLYALMQENLAVPSKQLIDDALDVVVFCEKIIKDSKIVRKVQCILDYKKIKEVA